MRLNPLTMVAQSDHSDFRIWVHSPANLRGIALMTSAAAAGGLGVLDFGLLPPSSWGDWQENMHSLQRHLAAGTPVAFRLSVEHLDTLLAASGYPIGRPVTIVFVGAKPSLSQLANLESVNAELYLEVATLAEIPDLLAHYPPKTLTGFVVASREAAGLCGKSPAYILCQDLEGLSGVRLLLRGGLGVNGAAACRAAGFDGLVLDDQVLLMEDSPLSPSQKNSIQRLEGREFEWAGPQNGPECLLPRHPEFTRAASQLAAWNQLDTQDNSEAKAIDWVQSTAQAMGWGDPAEYIWPIGQMCGMASDLAKQFHTTGKLIQAIQHAVTENIVSAIQDFPFVQDSPLAKLHGTSMPIVQGPMTQVSDRPMFAKAVADAGGLPFVALALLSGEKSAKLLQETAATMQGRPWGVGILGFVPPELRIAQTKEIILQKPAFAILAGGRPDQASELESAGISTYLHVPVPSLLRLFLQKGARKFIFEGRECGGHVGPLHSAVLWEMCIHVLLDELPPAELAKCQILFAGGIHNATSSAILAALAAPLAANGVKLGLLMGTAYLSTVEAVAFAAISPSFQQQLIASEQLVLLRSGVGHANRCLNTPFYQEFEDLRRDLLRKGANPEEAQLQLDELLLGRLRMAAKGEKRLAPGQYGPISEEEQDRLGMFMAGEVARLISSTQSIAQLHAAVTQEAQVSLNNISLDTYSKMENQGQPVDIAIVGMNVLVPGAQKLEAYWNLILQKKLSTGEIPADRWDWRVYYDPNKRAEDKIYARWGGFFEDVLFDPLKYGIPPKSVPNIAVSQLLALECTSWALEDAGMDPEKMDRANTSVIFAAADSGGFLGNQLVARSYYPVISSEGKEEAFNRMPGWTEETFPGILSNIVAGRIANRFDFGGCNFAVDAACASSLVAVDLAVRELASGRSNVAIAGAVDVGQTPFGYLAFSKTGALSATGDSLPFDKKANGIVISEGVAVLVLKRLADAERDGDRVYAVIKGIAGSSDGRAMGMTAPRPEGQRLSLIRAYREAGFSPSEIGMYEAHGTGTTVGDTAEIETITQTLLKEGAKPASIALGSVKSIIGHTKTVAGMVSLAKTALSLYYKVLPPHLGVDEPLEPITEEGAPVVLYAEPKPWFRPNQYPRRAGISAFGFGGTNYHAVLEEHDSAMNAPKLGQDEWPSELLVFAAESKQALQQLLVQLGKQVADGLDVRLRDLALSLCLKHDGSTKPHRLALVVQRLEALPRLLEKAISFLDRPDSGEPPAHIHYVSSESRQGGKVAFLFSGQGSQNVQMAREMSLYFREFRDNLEQMEQTIGENYPARLSDLIYPAQAFDPAKKEAQAAVINDTHLAQPAIGMVSTSYLDLLARLGIKPDMVAGHSYGEFVALHAGGVIDREDLMRLSEFRGRVMAMAGNGTGTMAAVMMSKSDMEAYLAKSGLDLTIANHNAPEQVVISGPVADIIKAKNDLGAMGIRTIGLPVSAAFHSQMMKEAWKPLHASITGISMKAPEIPVYSNTTGAAYPSDTGLIRELLGDHLLKPVAFVDQVNAMHEAGARIFVELGPRQILTGLLGMILGDQPHIAMAAEGNGAGINSFHAMIGELWTQGVNMKLEALFQDRKVSVLDMDRLTERHGKPKPKPTSWWLNGQSARPVNEKLNPNALVPLINSQTKMKPMEVASNGVQTQPAVVAQPQNPPVAQMGMQQVNPGQGMDPTMAAFFAYQETMRQFLLVQERIMRLFLGSGEPDQMTMNGIPAIPAVPFVQQVSMPQQMPMMPPQQMQAVAQAVSAPEPVKVAAPQIPAPQPPAAQMAPETAPDVLSPDSVRKILVGLITDLTGYPEDMIDFEQDLEAELGVDSIKRVNIYEAFVKQLPSNLIQDFSARADQFVRIKKLNELVHKLSEALNLGKEEGVPMTASRGN